MKDNQKDKNEMFVFLLQIMGNGLLPLLNVILEYKKIKEISYGK